jgi:hypothetical protein
MAHLVALSHHADRIALKADGGNASRLVRQRELGEDPRSGIGLDRGGTTPWNPLERQIV